MMSCGPSQASGNVIIFITYVQHPQAAVCTVRCLLGETDTAIWPCCFLVYVLLWTRSSEEAELASEWPRAMDPGPHSVLEHSARRFLLPAERDG